MATNEKVAREIAIMIAEQEESVVPLYESEIGLLLNKYYPPLPTDLGELVAEARGSWPPNQELIDRLCDTLEAARSAPVQGTWAWALERMKAGKRVQRQPWQLTGYLAFDRDGRCYYESDTRARTDWQPYRDDFDATDWRIVE